MVSMGRGNGEEGWRKCQAMVDRMVSKDGENGEQGCRK